MHNVSIGVDLHKHQLTVCFFSGTDAYHSKYATNKDGLNKFKADVKSFIDKGFDVRVAVESTGNTRYFCNEIASLGIETFIVNTLKFKVVNESVNKTDKRDARVIAEFLHKDMLPLVKLTSETSENLRQMMSIRKDLVRTRVRLKNKIHGILLSAGIETKAGQLNSKKGLVKILIDIGDSEKKILINRIINSIEALSIEIKAVEDEIMGMTENSRTVKILQSIPGTGLITAATIASYIDDIKRFSHYNKFSAYCGLVPWVQCSDETKHYGKITKRGPVELRTAMIQMVLGMVRCKDEKNNRLMVVYKNMKKNKGSGKAIVATARKLTKIIWTMLTNDEDYKKDKVNKIYDDIHNDLPSQEKGAA